MEVKINQEWKNLLECEFDKPYFSELVKKVKDEYKIYKVFPLPQNIFRAFDLCSPSTLKVVILGQDPYHGINQANGLAFSVSEDVRLPPSLRNIFLELKSDLGIDKKLNGDLSGWAKQGVLLLNTSLTVRMAFPNSHKDIGWEKFTDQVIKIISSKFNNIVFVLWGAFAQKKEILIDASKHCIVKSAHPSPFSADRGFFGSKPFSIINNYLEGIGKAKIDW